MLERLLEALEVSGISRVLCVVGHMEEAIMEYLDRRPSRISVEIIRADGTSMGRSFLSLADKIIESFILTPCDIVIRADELQWLFRSLQDSELAMGVSKRIFEANPLPVVVNESGFIQATGVNLKQHTHYFTGVCRLDQEVFHLMQDTKSFELSQILHLPAVMLQSGMRIRAYEVSCAIDVDTVEHLEEAEKLLGCR